MGRGALIVIEGVDRSGKTTQTHRCVDALRSAGVAVAEGAPWRFPNRTTPIGKMIDSYLQNATEMDNHALHLLFSANRWEQRNQIVHTLTSGATVLLDRYVYSGVAYSAAKGLSHEWCKAPDTGLPTPDLAIYLDLPLTVAEKRGNFGMERYENESMQRAVATQFQKFKMRPEWHVVDANESADIVFERIMDLILPVLVRIQNNQLPLNSLW